MFACVYAKGVFEREELVALAYRFSPRVEETADDTVVFDIAGCETLFGPPRIMADAILRRARRIGLSAGVAVAANVDTAILVAKQTPIVDGGNPSPVVIPPGEELQYLGDIPVRSFLTDLSSLFFNDELSSVNAYGNGKQTLSKNQIKNQKEQLQRLNDIVETLELWGVYSFRDFASLPEAGIAERLGEDGLRLQKLARGDSDRQLKLSIPEHGFARSVELEDPIELLEPLSFILAHLINQLCSDLKNRGLAALELRLSFKLEDQTRTERLIRLPFPMRDPKTFLRLFLLDIESHPVQSGIIAASLDCEAARPRVIQNGLFHPLAPEPEKLELTIARIARLVGAENIGCPELVDTHRSDSFRMKQFTPLNKFKNPRGHLDRRAQAGVDEVRGNCLLGFRVLRPPLGARVEAPGGTPIRISAPSRNAITRAQLIRENGAAMDGYQVKTSFLPDRELPVEQSKTATSQTNGIAGDQGTARELVSITSTLVKRGAVPVIRGRVIRAAGPWRTSGDWWMADGWARDEWDVVIGVSDGEDSEKQVVCRIYFDHHRESWFVEGTYD